jgi:hypothetical protein
MFFSNMGEKQWNCPLDRFKKIFVIFKENPWDISVISGGK